MKQTSLMNGLIISILILLCLVFQVAAKETLPAIGVLANATAEEGDDVYLDCPVTNKTAASKVQWFRIIPGYLHISNDETLLTTNTEKYGVTAMGAVSTQAVSTVTLIIKHVTDTDVGRYRCRVQIPQVAYPRWPSKDVFVTIAAAPIIQSVGNTKMVSAVGEDVTLTCRVYGVPEPTITWYKGDAGTNIMGHGEVLHLENLRAGDGGEYRCEVDNGVLPNAVETYHITLKQEPMCSAPQLHVMQAKNIFQPAEMTCHVTGYPVPKVTWKRYTIHGIQAIFTSNYDIQNIIPKDNSGVMTSVLKVHNVTSSDYGTYICEGSNDSDQCTAEVILLESRSCVGPRCDSHAGPGDTSSVTSPAPSDDDDNEIPQGHKADDKDNAGVAMVPSMTFICVLSICVFFVTKWI